MWCCTLDLLNHHKIIFEAGIKMHTLENDQLPNTGRVRFPKERILIDGKYYSDLKSEYLDAYDSYVELRDNECEDDFKFLDGFGLTQNSFGRIFPFTVYNAVYSQSLNPKMQRDKACKFLNEVPKYNSNKDLYIHLLLPQYYPYQDTGLRFENGARTIARGLKMDDISRTQSENVVHSIQYVCKMPNNSKISYYQYDENKNAIGEYQISWNLCGIIVSYKPLGKSSFVELRNYDVVKLNAQAKKYQDECFKKLMDRAVLVD